MIVVVVVVIQLQVHVHVAVRLAACKWPPRESYYVTTTGLARAQLDLSGLPPWCVSGKDTLNGRLVILLGAPPASAIWTATIL